MNSDKWRIRPWLRHHRGCQLVPDKFSYILYFTWHSTNCMNIQKACHWLTYLSHGEILIFHWSVSPLPWIFRTDLDLNNGQAVTQKTNFFSVRTFLCLMFDILSWELTSSQITFRTASFVALLLLFYLSCPAMSRLPRFYLSKKNTQDKVYFIDHNRLTYLYK